MFCPKCKSEYREGITECVDCLTPLIPELESKEVKKDNSSSFFMLRLLVGFVITCLFIILLSPLILFSSKTGRKILLFILLLIEYLLYVRYVWLENDYLFLPIIFFSFILFLSFHYFGLWLDKPYYIFICLTDGIKFLIPKLRPKFAWLFDSSAISKISFLRVYYCCNLLTSDKARKNDKRLLYKMFLIYFVTMITIVLFSFGFIYLAIDKLDYSHFKGIDNDLWKAVYFSGFTFFTISFEDVQPITLLAKFFTFAEIIAAFYLLYLIILSFLTLSLQKAENAAEKILNDLVAARKYLEAKGTEMYSLSLQELNAYTYSSDDENDKKHTLHDIPTKIVAYISLNLGRFISKLFFDIVAILDNPK
ncbi:MAG: potassium channel family protein [Candidatus Omnitrophica bacterium]|nr:potassium channel family protein [Candidatus Omnitrophota bacterium]